MLRGYHKVQSAMSTCTLCVPSDLTVIDVPHWSMRVNADQKYLGRCYFALDRHELDVTKLTADELSSLWDLFRNAKAALDKLFSPDHYNYVFLMNMSKHLHPHIIPRYVAPREFFGQEFVDGRFGDHCDFNDNHFLSNDDLIKLAATIREAMGR